MLDFHQKRKVRGVLYNRVTLVILGLLVLFFFHSTWKVYNKKRESAGLEAAALRHVEELRLRDEELNSKIKKLETTAGIEEEIRSKFSVAKADENVVVIVNTENEKATTTAKKRGFWGKIINLWR